MINIDKLIEVIEIDIKFFTNKCIDPNSDERERLVAASKIEALYSVLSILKLGE